MKKEKLSFVYAGLAIFFWSTPATVYKLTLPYIQPIQLVFWMTCVSTIILFFILISQKKLKLLKKIKKRDCIRSSILGFANPFLFYCFLLQAYSLLPAQEAQTLFYSWPAMLALLSIPLLKQKISIPNALSIIVSFLGVFVISTHGNILDFHISNPLGACIVLLSACIWAMFWIFDIKDKRDGTVKLFLNMVFSLLYITFINIFSSSLYIPSVTIIGSVLYLALFDICLPFLLWSLALKYAKNAVSVSKYVYLVPFLSLIVIHFVLKEEILPSTLFGLGIIVIGIFTEQIYDWIQKRLLVLGEKIRFS